MNAVHIPRRSEEQTTDVHVAALSARSVSRSIILRNHAMVTSVVAVVGPIVFFTIMLVLGAITPGYNAVSRFGSELSLAPLGWIMIANFICFGLIVGAFGLVLYRAIGPHRSGRIGAAMVVLSGLAFVDTGVFVTDLNGKVVTIHGALHFAAAVTIFFIAGPTAAMAMAWRFRENRRFAAYSALTAVSIPILFVATVGSGSMLGLMERIVIGVVLAWLAVLALCLGPWRAASASDDTREIQTTRAAPES